VRDNLLKKFNVPKRISEKHRKKGPDSGEVSEVPKFSERKFKTQRNS